MGHKLRGIQSNFQKLRKIKEIDSFLGPLERKAALLSC